MLLIINSPIMKKTENTADQTARIRTPEGVDVTQRVNDGRTRLFFTAEKAKAHADQRRSYVYPGFDAKSNFLGYCVPN